MTQGIGGDLAPVPTPPWRAVAATVALAVATFVFVTAELLPIGLLTVMSRDLDRSRSDIGLLVTGYATVVVLASLPLTWLTARVPRRSLLGTTLATFAVATLLTAAAPGYGLLFVARLVTALTQALFWSVVIATAAGLFAPGIRGRIVARLQIGTALGPVIGVPTGTWLGQQAGWRVPFVVLSAVVALTGAAVLWLLPSVPPDEAGAARGIAPDRRRYAVIVTVTALAATGGLTAYTYITPFLLDVTGFGPAALGPLLLVGGLAGAASLVVFGPLLDRYPGGAIVVPVAMLTSALVILHLGGANRGATVLALAIFGAAMSGLASSVGAATLYLAPGRTDLAAAGSSSAFNVGIATGSTVGGALVAGVGVAAVAPAGAIFAALALAVLVAGMRPSPRAVGGPG